MNNPGILKIFSSHCWDYNNHRQGLHNLLAPTWVKNVDFIDLSIPRAHPVDVESDLGLAYEIRDRIRASDVFVVFAGMYVNNSEWVRFEIHSAFNDSCPIVTVVPFGQQRLSRTARKFATREVAWRGDSIRSAIVDVLPETRRSEFLAGRRARTAPRLLLQSSRVPGALETPTVFDLLGVPPPKRWP